MPYRCEFWPEKIQTFPQTSSRQLSWLTWKSKSSLIRLSSKKQLSQIAFERKKMNKMSLPRKEINWVQGFLYSFAIKKLMQPISASFFKIFSLENLAFCRQHFPIYRTWNASIYESFLLKAVLLNLVVAIDRYKE